MFIFWFMENSSKKLLNANTTPFRLTGLLPGTGHGWLDSIAANTVEQLLGLSNLDAAYRRIGFCDDSDEFILKACAALNIELRFPDSELSHIPASGPVVVVANHPFGGIEGLLLAGMLRRVRKDVRVMTNYLLGRIPEVSELFIGVDPFNGPQAQNAAGLRQALRWLQDGGMLLVFPAGEVSHWHLNHQAIIDPPWNAGIARLVHLAKASVLPVYIYGNNSLLFQVAGLLHPRLRTALLAKEMLNKANTRVALRIGHSLTYCEIKGLDSEQLIRFLRLRTYLLGAMNDELEVPRVTMPVATIAVSASEHCAHEVAALPSSQRMAESGEFSAYIAHAAQIPELLQEIGRQRELTFRAVGEGTGRAIDLDGFDADYMHLFVWHEKARELVGAYRLGLADHILAHRGCRGLYTCQLFKIKKQLFEQMGPAIELGRSFVRAEYQRSFTPLLLLWKGITAFVARHPHYKVLFGPVSISTDYTPVSRQLIIDYLRSALLSRNLSHCVKPRNKPIYRHGLWQASDLATLGDIEHVSTLVAGVEADGKGIPVLLRKYLKLGGRILGFNRDPDFNNAIDALIMVDLSRCELNILQRYMGKQAAIDYLALHNEINRAA